MKITSSPAADATTEDSHDAAAGQFTASIRQTRMYKRTLSLGTQPWSIDLALFLGMFLFLAMLALLLRISFVPRPGTQQFVLQAQAWLHGHLDVMKTTNGDFVLVNGKYYIIYPPLPALLMLPFVAVLGSHFSDVWFTWLAGAANVALTYRVLAAMRQHGWTRRTQRENIMLALVFGTGTIALWLTLGGRVWFTAQTLAITALLVMLYGAVAQRWWLASLGVGAALLTRSPDALGGIFVLVAFARAHGIGVPSDPPTNTLWQKLRWRPATQPTPASLLALCLPFLIACIMLALRNQLYFGSALNTGYALQLYQDYPQIQYGLLSWHYVWPNFVVDFLNFPAFTFTSPYDVKPHIDLLQNGNGTSIFFTTPLFLLLFIHYGKARLPWLQFTLWLVVALLVTFTLFWNLTGWYQVGARYLFDIYPFLFMLLALRAGGITTWWLALATAGILINIALASTFWCGDNRCLGTHYTTPRHLILWGLLAGVVGAAVLAWQWLRHEREQGEGTNISA